MYTQPARNDHNHTHNTINNEALFEWVLQLWKKIIRRKRKKKLYLTVKPNCPNWIGPKAKMRTQARTEMEESRVAMIYETLHSPIRTYAGRSSYYCRSLRLLCSISRVQVLLHKTAKWTPVHIVHPRKSFHIIFNQFVSGEILWI